MCNNKNIINNQNLNIRIVSSKIITEVVSNLCIDSNCNISQDIEDYLQVCIEKEKSEIGKEILTQLKENANIARKKQMPICQDTGMAVIFCEVGQNVYIDGNLNKAIEEGVRIGYEKGYLRKSVVKDPFHRENTKDNTPAIIYYNIVEGDKIKITVAPKGFGSENMSKIYMLKPADGLEGAKRKIIETVEKSGGNACPPMIIGVGIGGTFEKAALLSKQALLRPIGKHSNLPYVRKLEEELLNEINNLGIGPQGLGGTTTAYAVNIETYPTHIAGLPVAVNISCHATRHSTQVI